MDCDIIFPNYFIIRYACAYEWHISHIHTNFYHRAMVVCINVVDAGREHSCVSLWYKLAILMSKQGHFWSYAVWFEMNMEAHSWSSMKARAISSYTKDIELLFILATFKCRTIELLYIKHMQKSIDRNHLSRALIFVTTGYDIPNIGTS